MQPAHEKSFTLLHANDVRVIRLPRHGASCPVGIALSCSADRQMRVSVQPGGVFFEKLEYEPQKLFELHEEERKVETLKVANALDVNGEEGGEKTETVSIDLDQPMEVFCAQ